MTVTREISTDTIAIDTVASGTARSGRAGTAHRGALRAGAAMLVVIAIAGSVGCAGAAQADVPPPVLYVSPTGTDLNTGLTTARPFRTIQHALDLAQPGTTISLGPGSYHESVDTKIDGTALAPITIQGTGAGTGNSAPAVTVYGTSHVFDIHHSYYKLDGFAINGEEALVGKTFPTTMSQAVPFKDANQSVIVDSRPIYVSSNDPAGVVTNLTISNMTVSGSGGECIRLRNTSNSTITNTVVSFCGLTAKQTDGTYLYHNGEGIYIGTSPKAGSPVDNSSNNVMTGNKINTFGSECLDVKENSHDNVFAGNDCGFNIEPAAYYGSNIELRGYHNTIDNNRISQSASIGVKLKSDSAALGIGQNSVTRNTFVGQFGFTVRNEQTTLGTLCGNVFPVAASFYGTAASAASAGCPQ